MKIIKIIIALIFVEIGAVLINCGVYNMFDKRVRSGISLMVTGLLVVSISAFNLFGIAEKNVFPRNKEEMIIIATDLKECTKIDYYLHTTPVIQVPVTIQTTLVSKPLILTANYIKNNNIKSSVVKRKRINKHKC